MSTKRLSRRAATHASALEPIEEKVLRIRQGVAASPDHRLERVGQDHPALREKLWEIELRALERSGRLEELREEGNAASVDTAASVNAKSGSTKAKIIARLKSPSPRGRSAETRTFVETKSKGRTRGRSSRS